MKPQFVVIPTETFFELWYLLGYAEAVIDSRDTVNERVQMEIKRLNEVLRKAYENASDDL